jgi:hypothetical protein
MNKQIVSVNFDFSEKYTDSNGRTSNATVRLSIDVKRKSFNVTPNETKQDFVFINTSQHNWQMWIAIAKAIQTATEFGVQFLEDVDLKV